MTSFFMLLSTFWCHDVCLYIIMYFRTYWSYDEPFESWITFWRHDVPFDIGTFSRHDVLSIYFDVMTYFFTLWRTLCCRDVFSILFDVIAYFLTSSRIFDIMAYFPYFLTSWPSYVLTLWHNLCRHGVLFLTSWHMFWHHDVNTFCF